MIALHIDECVLGVSNVSYPVLVINHFASDPLPAASITTTLLILIGIAESYCSNSQFDCTHVILRLSKLEFEHNTIHM